MCVHEHREAIELNNQIAIQFCDKKLTTIRTLISKNDITCETVRHDGLPGYYESMFHLDGRTDLSGGLRLYVVVEGAWFSEGKIEQAAIYRGEKIIFSLQHEVMQR